MPETMRLLKCPACGGPLEPPAGESTMKCTYCGNAVIIPESLRISKSESSSQASIFSGIDMNAMVGYGTHWAEVVRLAQSGNKPEAVKKYVALTGNSESSASSMVDNLAGYQSYEFMPGASQTVQQIYAPYMNTVAETVKTTTRWSLWLGCGITAFVLCIVLVTLIPVLVGVFTSLMSMFR